MNFIFLLPWDVSSGPGVAPIALFRHLGALAKAKWSYNATYLYLVCYHFQLDSIVYSFAQDQSSSYSKLAAHSSQLFIRLPI